jgi:hypothetical protein
MSDGVSVLAVQTVAGLLLYLVSLLVERIETGAAEFDALHREVAEAEAHT